MKTTVKVSIGRLAFNVDSDAYQRLKNYLDRLEKHFADKESGKEIVSDIEERLAELLAAQLSQPTQVVTLAMVEEVIAIMGMPDDMEDNEPINTTTSNVTPPVGLGRRLYRDKEHKIIGGVCSGLAAYFNIDAVFIRLFFVLFLFSFSIFPLFYHSMSGTAILAYLILWAVMPAAHTPKEKLEMYGKHKPTVSGIEKKLLEDTEKPQENGLVRMLNFIARLFIIFFGIILLIIALSGFLLIPSLLLFDVAPNITVFGLLDYVHIGPCAFLFKLFLALVLFLPFMGLVYLAVKAIMGFRDKYRIGLLVFLCWIAAVIGLSAVSFPALRAYTYWEKETAQVVVEHSSDTLYINVSDKYKAKHNQMIFDYRDKRAFSALWSAKSAGQTSFYLLPQVKIIPVSDTGAIRIKYTCRAAGRNRYMAQENVDNMLQKAFLKDSLLLLEPFVFDKKTKWSGELMKMKIYVPRGKAVKLDMFDKYHNQMHLR
ncbi:MAG: PspC domain-containing protein [Bacteroidales bacterium]|nr:PspC domain-containing protein [Bacteroidales bacterium]MCL2133405.1 PspC domain-containing protein [Bacteroidales bacterium]